MYSTIEKSRIDWVDYAKGVCIILVVMMHTTLGVEKALGTDTWLHPFIDWARPFRMPDFFLISGLFLASRIEMPWRAYFDSKVLHFIYFYVLWMTIQYLSKSYGLYHELGMQGMLASYVLGFIEPFGTLWFIYILAAFFALTKLTRHVPPFIILAIAAIFEAAHIETGWTLVDEFASRFVYFFAGYWLAKYVFKFADQVNMQKVLVVISGLIVWGFANYLLVQYGYSQLPFLGLLLGVVGAGAVVSFSVLLTKSGFADAIRFCGKNSIVIYLGFFLFMASSRSLMLKFMHGMDGGITALIVTTIGVIGPILLFWGTKGTRLDFLFHRPNWARLAKEKKQWHSAPHATKLRIKTR
jgi:uncharacterized membrane protein YcfT